jgi:hypothetical protein
MKKSTRPLLKKPLRKAVHKKPPKTTAQIEVATGSKERFDQLLDDTIFGVPETTKKK